MDGWKMTNVKFCTAWDLNARCYVRVDKAMKIKSRRYARRKLKDQLTND